MNQENTSRKSPDSRANITKGSLMAAAGAVCWGFSGCCGQFLFVERGVQAPWLVTLRLVIAGIFLIINGFILSGRDNLRIFYRKADRIHLIVFGLAGITFCQFSYFMAVQTSNAGTATVLQYLFFSGKVVKRLSYLWRMVIFAVLLLGVVSGCAVAFRWFPLDQAGYWLTFAGFFLLGYLVHLPGVRAVLPLPAQAVRRGPGPL